MAGPTFRRRQLGIELRRLREAAGISPNEVAEILGSKRTRVTYIEQGRNVVSKSELVVLVRDHFGASERLAELECIRQEADKRGWWSTYGLSERAAGYVGLEDDAESLRTADVGDIPGLLQTEQYIRRQCKIDIRLSAKEIDKRVAVRLRRQARLTGANPLLLKAVVDEAPLLRCARDPEVTDQLAHLIEVSQWPNVDLRILPFDLGLHVGQAGSFSVLSFPDGVLPDVGYQEYIVGGHVIDQEPVVKELATLFDELHRLALGPTESLSLIAQLAKHP
jgi:transcriptional regulator with XRE-family HTH domain